MEAEQSTADLCAGMATVCFLNIEQIHLGELEMLKTDRQTAVLCSDCSLEPPALSLHHSLPRKHGPVHGHVRLLFD